jgi:hypothetical protein
VTSDAEVGATFVPLRLVTVTVSGGGSVTSSPPGLACTSGTCSAPFVAGTEVTLTATPASGWTFLEWGGDRCAGTGACAFSLSAPATVGATFSPSSGAAVTFQGRVTYDFVPAIYDPVTKAGTLSFASATVKPVRGAVVRVLDGSAVLATGTTDHDGNYSLTFFPGAATTVFLEALARTTAPAIQVEDNTDADAVWGIRPPLPVEATTGVHNLHAPHGWTGASYDPEQRAAAPFAILDSMYTAAKGFLDAPRAVPFPPLRVNWSPANSPSATYSPATGAIITSHYSPADGEIYILGLAGADTDEFDAHVIVHEWGHFFEARLSRADSPGGPHGPGDVLDPRLAFGEGYGTALASMLLPEPLYVDTQWVGSSIRAFGISAETTYSDDPLPGPFSELSVLRLLYDVFDDAGTSESWDALSVGLGPIYDVLVGPQRATPALTTVGSFVSALKAHPDVDPAGVDALLAHYAIEAISDAWGTGDPALRGVYVDVGSLPYSGSATLTGGPLAWNKRQAVQYWVVAGTGRNVTVRSASTSDVGLVAYRTGQPVAYADRFLENATETMTFPTTAGTRYVVVLTGYETQDIAYAASLTVESP